MPLLAACGSDPEAATDPTGGHSSTSAGSTSSAPGGAEVLAKTTDIEVGGGAIFADEQVVVTQPSAGEFKCFTSICTHQGCPVTSVSDGTINCDCHGSQYSIEDGSVITGPATFPLAEEQITVSGSEITLNA